MRKISCIIVDDEPIARKVLRDFTGQAPFLELKGEFQNISKMETSLLSSPIDLIFLDIEMPKRSGLDFLKNTATRPMVIITTAYSEYATEGYELDIIDYLLKPIALSRFQKAVQKAREYAELKAVPQPHPSWFFVRSERKIEKVELNDIIYVESTGNYLTIVTENKKIIAYLTLKGLETQLPPARFIKIHNSFLVNFEKIESFDGTHIHIKTHKLPVSRSYRDMLMHIIDQRLIKRL